MERFCSISGIEQELTEFKKGSKIFINGQDNGNLFHPDVPSRKTNARHSNWQSKIILPNTEQNFSIDGHPLHCSFENLTTFVS